jgi:hypothetical protein
VSAVKEKSGAFQVEKVTEYAKKLTFHKLQTKVYCIKQVFCLLLCMAAKLDTSL